MRTPTQRQKPRKAQFISFPVPTAGLIRNRNIAAPNGQGQTPGAEIMENWFPTASSIVMRRGLSRHATIPGGETVKSMFGFVYGAQKELFAATDSGIWNVTTSTPASVLSGTTSGEWSVLQFSTAAGNFLIGVNGVDDGWIYDGVSFEPLAVTGVGTSELVHVWSYKQRIWFIQKESLDAWYLPVDSIAGAAVWFPLGGVFNRGGSVLWGQTWSLDSGGDGGLSEQCVFVTSEGEVAAYQGLSPDDASQWSKVGVYRIGRPMGRRAFIRAGGDLVIATTIGFIPLGQAIRNDYAALGMVAVSQPIADEWAMATRDRGTDGWQCVLWGEGSMTMVVPPTLPSQDPIALVANSDTGAWATFTGWRPTAIEVFDGKLYFGSTGGKVQQAWIGGSDEGQPYTATFLPLFTDLGTPGQRKFASLARVVKRSSFPTDERIAARFDWNLSEPTPPNPAAVPGVSLWDAGIWDESRWDEQRGAFVTSEWRGIGGSGSAMSVIMQATSGGAIPIDLEIVRIDCTYQLGAIVT